MSDEEIKSDAAWERNRRLAQLGDVNCDCGHPASFHRGVPNLCVYSPPHSHVRCACSAVTQLGVIRNELFVKS